MRRLALSAALVLALVAPAAAQVNPLNMPSNTVYGRLGIGAGPGQAIPFAVFVAQLSAASTSGNNTFTGTNNFTGTFQIGGVTIVFPASGAVVGTTDTQTITGKSIDGSEINSGTVVGSYMASVNLGTGGNGGVNGTLGVPSGGTGQTSLTAQGVVIGEGAFGVHVIATNSNGLCLVSQGAGVDPNWGSCATGAVINPGSYIAVSGSTVSAPFVAASMYAHFGGL